MVQRVQVERQLGTGGGRIQDTVQFYRVDRRPGHRWTEQVLVRLLLLLLMMLMLLQVVAVVMVNGRQAAIVERWRRLRTMCGNRRAVTVAAVTAGCAGGAAGSRMEKRFQLAKVECLVVDATDKVGMTCGAKKFFILFPFILGE